MFVPPRPRLRRRAAVSLALLSIGTTLPAVTFAQATPEKPTPLVEMSESDRTTMTDEIVDIANRVANARKYFDDEVRPITITGAFDVESNVFHFDMEERFGPDAGYDELADMHRAIEITIEPLTDRVDKLYAIYWTYGGKDIDYWMPPPVVVAAGHGYYFHLKEKTWKPHREPSNGRKLRIRRGVCRAASESSRKGHGPSGLPC